MCQSRPPLALYGTELRENNLSSTGSSRVQVFSFSGALRQMRIPPLIAVIVLGKLGLNAAFVPSACSNIHKASISSHMTQQLTYRSIAFETILMAEGNSQVGSMESVFKFIRSDALSLTVGSLCLLALVTNRLYTDPLFDSQSRTDILGVFSAGGLLLNGLTLQVR